MDQPSYDDINRDILRATLMAFSARAFSGDIEFRLWMRQTMRLVCEVHHAESIQTPATIQHSFDAFWPKIASWVAMRGTVLTVSFQGGRITRVKNVDDTQDSEMGRMRAG